MEAGGLVDDKLTIRLKIWTIAGKPGGGDGGSVSGFKKAVSENQAGD